MSMESPSAADEVYQSRLDFSRGSKNEMSPQSAVHTSFWPVRAFLWASFKSAMCLPLLFPAQSSFLTQPFSIGERQLHGVFVMEFEYSTPQVANLQTCVLDQTQMELWAPLAEASWRQATVAEFSERGDVKALRGGHSAALDVIHGLERLKTQNTLRSSIGSHLRRPVYRSAHLMQAALDALNEGMVRCLAISYERTAVPANVPTRTRSQKAFVPKIRKIWRRLIRRDSP